MMLEFLDRFTIVFLQVLFAEAVLLHKAERRSRFPLRVLLTLGISVGFFILRGQLIELADTGIINTIGYIVVWCVAAASVYVCFKLSVLSAVFVAGAAYALQHIAYALITFLGLCMPQAAFLQDYRLAVCFPFLFAFIVGLVLVHLTPKAYNTTDKRQIVFSLLLLLLSTALDCLRGETLSQSPFTHLYDIIGCVACLLIQFSISREEKARLEKQSLQMLITKQHEQHEVTRQAVEMMNIKLHDLRNQLNHLEAALSSGEAQQVENLKRTISIYSSAANTGNATIDAVLVEKSLLCEINHIRFSYIINGHLVDFMETVDLFSLLNNLLDNAIESELKEPDTAKRVICIRVAEAGDAILLNVENYCAYPIDLHGGELLPATSKENKSLHGFGRKSIYLVMEKYHGTLHMLQEDNMIYVSVLLPSK